MALMQVARNLLKKNVTISTLYKELNFQRKNPQNFSKIGKEYKKIISEIQKNSFCIIPNFVGEEFCNNCIKDIDSMMENHKEFVQKQTDLRIFGAEEFSENIKKFADHNFLNNFANYYNGSRTYNAFTLANRIEFNEESKKLGSGGGWHRDQVTRVCKAVLYLNDVDETNGTYQIIKNSHKLSSMIKDSKSAKMYPQQTRFSDQQIEFLLSKDPERLITITGKKGTLILKDCSAIHRGSPLQQGKRYALTNYFFRQNQLTEKLVEHFSPIVSPEKVLKLVLK